MRKFQHENSVPERVCAVTTFAPKKINDLVWQRVRERQESRLQEGRKADECFYYQLLNDEQPASSLHWRRGRWGWGRGWGCPITHCSTRTRPGLKLSLGERHRLEILQLLQGVRAGAILRGGRGKVKGDCVVGQLSATAAATAILWACRMDRFARVLL